MTPDIPKDLIAVAAQLWTLPQHSRKAMDVEFAEDIALSLLEERKRGDAEANRFVRLKKELWATHEAEVKSLEALVGRLVEALKLAVELDHCDIFEMRHDCELYEVKQKCDEALLAAREKGFK